MGRTIDRAWITGGYGFAGRHLAHVLRERRIEVIAIDRPERQRPADLETEILQLDLSDSEAVVAALLTSRPDQIFHLAAQSRGGRSFAIPRMTLRNNIESTLGLLEGLREVRERGEVVPRLLSVGSCEEYGPPASDEELPLREDQPLRPMNPYAVSKAAQTMLCRQYRHVHQLPVLSVRSFSHTGPGQSPDFVFSSFAQQIARIEHSGNEGVLKVGNLDVSRDVSDVSDIVRAYADLADVEWETDVVNVCSGRELWLQQGLEQLIALGRAKILVEEDPARLRPTDVHRFVGDPTLLRRMIGWVPNTAIEDTLQRLLDWWRLQVATDCGVSEAD